MKKLGLALGAGGSRGVAHIGFLKALEEENVTIDYIVGASMGSVVGGAYAAGVPVDLMREAVCKLRLLDLIAPAKQKGGVLGNVKMRNLIAKYIGEVTFDKLRIPFHCIAGRIFRRLCCGCHCGIVLYSCGISSDGQGRETFD